VRLRERDTDLANPAASTEWITRCRDCGRTRGQGTVGSLALFVVAVTASLVFFFTFSPFLGAIVMTGAVLGLGRAMVPAVIDRFVRWLSFGR